MAEGHADIPSTPDAVRAVAIEQLWSSLELDVMPTSPTAMAPDCDWNTQQFHEVAILLVNKMIDHGVHPAAALPEQSDWPVTPWESRNSSMGITATADASQAARALDGLRALYDNIEPDQAAGPSAQDTCDELYRLLGSLGMEVS